MSTGVDRACMWLEYAALGDEHAKKATGLDVHGCIRVAYGLLKGGTKFAREQDARHYAECAIEDAQFQAKGDE
jgi:hypothetical protein